MKAGYLVVVNKSGVDTVDCWQTRRMSSRDESADYKDGKKEVDVLKYTIECFQAVSAKDRGHRWWGTADLSTCRNQSPKPLALTGSQVTLSEVRVTVKVDLCQVEMELRLGEA